MSFPIERFAVCSWSFQPASPADLVDKLQATGVLRTQLMLHAIIECPRLWADTIKILSEAGIEVASGCFGTIGEDYTSLETIRLTGGLAPDKHWKANVKLAAQIADLAASYEIRRVGFHAGFIPQNRNDSDFMKLVRRLRQVAERFAANNIDLMLETGQETAETLLAFLEAVEQPNLGVNFDPANMILYAMGDPIASLKVLIPHVKQVHIKDALPANAPGTWGTEVVVGTGAVDWPTFVGVLNEASYTGNLVIEREVGNNSILDIKEAIRVITSADRPSTELAY